jgi:hypothetical protein
MDLGRMRWVMNATAPLEQSRQQRDSAQSDAGSDLGRRLGQNYAGEAPREAASCWRAHSPLPRLDRPATLRGPLMARPIARAIQ